MHGDCKGDEFYQKYRVCDCGICICKEAAMQNSYKILSEIKGTIVLPFLRAVRWPL